METTVLVKIVAIGTSTCRLLSKLQLKPAGIAESHTDWFIWNTNYWGRLTYGSNEMVIRYTDSTFGSKCLIQQICDQDSTTTTCILGLMCFGINSSQPAWWCYWCHRSGSTMSHVMACCLMAPSHYLDQCLFIIDEVLWHSPEGNFMRDTQAVFLWYEGENYKFHNTTASSRDQWVKLLTKPWSYQSNTENFIFERSLLNPVSVYLISNMNLLLNT